MFFRKKPIENIIFLHLPKAGGTTLRQIFYKEYSHLKDGEVYTINRTKETPDFLKLSQEERDRIKLLVGHFPFGLHEKLNKEQKFVYTSFMRDPVERVLSAYNYAKTTPNHDFYQQINKDNIDLFRYVQELSFPWLKNGQTKFLAGVENFDEECTEEVYLKAKKNIDEKFIFTGILERYDESVLMLKKVLNLSLPLYKKLNKTRQKEQLIDYKSLELIQQNNKYDVRLYDYVIQKLEKEIASTPVFSLKMLIFKILNNFYGKY